MKHVYVLEMRFAELELSDIDKLIQEQEVKNTKATTETWFKALNALVAKRTNFVLLATAPLTLVNKFNWFSFPNFPKVQLVRYCTQRNRTITNCSSSFRRRTRVSLRSLDLSALTRLRIGNSTH
jgi:hypothetical protein